MSLHRPWCGVFAVETSPCERSSFWPHFLSTFLASQYGASPVGSQILRRRCIWFLGCLSGPICGTARRPQKWDRRLHLLSFLYTTGAPSTEAPISNKNMDPKLVSQLHIKSYAISTKTWLPSLELCKGVTNSQDDGPCPF